MNMKKFVCVAGIIVSIAIIIMGITTYLNADEFFIASGTKFGADFYTEIFEEVEQVKASVRSIDNAVYEVGGLLLISIGGINLCNFTIALSDALSKSKKQKNNFEEATKETSVKVQ